jgi:restriction endonuclease S subunit
VKSVDYTRRTMAEVAPLVRRPVQVLPTQSYQQIGIRSFGKGVFHKALTTGLEIGGKRVFSIEPGDLLFNIVFAWEGAVAVAAEEERGCIGSHRFLTCVVNPELADRRYLYWWFVEGRGREQLLRASPGGAGRNRTLGVQKLSAIEVPLPALEEQRRIVQCLDTLSQRIREAKLLRHEAAEAAHSLWQATASRKMRALIAGGCPVPKLVEVVDVRGGGTPSKANPLYWEGEIPWISPKDLKVRDLYGAEDHISEEATRATAAKLIKPGAVLVVVRGMILVHTFPTAVLRTAAAINQDMKALVPKPHLLPEFLCAVFWAFNPQILQLVDKSTHDTRRLDTPKLLELQIPLPPMETQRAIFRELEQGRTRIAALTCLQDNTHAELEALLPSVLNRTFKH